MEPPHKRGHVSKCDHLQKDKINKLSTTLLLSIIWSIFIAASHLLVNAEENGATSVMGDLGLTLRAAAISWSRLTNSVMDRRSSGFTFNIEPEQQDKCDTKHVRNAGLWSLRRKEGFLGYDWSKGGENIRMRSWYTTYLTSFCGMEYFPLTICSLAPSSKGCCLKHRR